MSRRHAARALLATAAVSAVTVGGFGLLSQPSAAGAQASPSELCILPGIICLGSSSAAPTGTASTTPTTGSAAPSSPAGTGSSSAPTGGSSSSGPSSAGSTSAAPSTDASPAAKPRSVVNVTLSRLRIAQHGKNLVVRFTVTNTGTVAIGGYLITAHVSGYQTRAWLSNLPVGQPVQVTASWPIVHHHALVRVLVKGDPRHQVKESDESDNTLSGSLRLR